MNLYPTLNGSCLTHREIKFLRQVLISPFAAEMKVTSSAPAGFSCVTLVCVQEHLKVMLVHDICVVAGGAVPCSGLSAALAPLCIY